jgi:ABC-type bacteriocin/lantibiotic exporter with double-glycine peptidase domain
MKEVTLTGIRCVRQRDGHGCGFCACAAVYRYYGLDTRSLRQRLGTDSQSVPFLMPCRDGLAALMQGLGLDTRGTLCPDVFAALYGDGFDTAYVAGAYGSYKKALHRHLLAGSPALALAAGMAHWIVVAGMDDSGILILDSSGYCDPLGEDTLRYRLTHGEFGALACGVVFVRRGKRAHQRPMTSLDFAWAYARGFEFSLRCLHRAVPHWIGLRAG